MIDLFVQQGFGEPAIDLTYTEDATLVRVTVGRLPGGDQGRVVEVCSNGRITLDGRPLVGPDGRPQQSPSEEAFEAIAAALTEVLPGEWEYPGQVVRDVQLCVQVAKYALEQAEEHGCAWCLAQPIPQRDPDNYPPAEADAIVEEMLAKYGRPDVRDDECGCRVWSHPKGGTHGFWCAQHHPMGDPAKRPRIRHDERCPLHVFALRKRQSEPTVRVRPGREDSTS